MRTLPASGASRDGASRRGRRSDGPIQYRLPKPGAEPERRKPVKKPEPVVEEPVYHDDDYTPMVRGVLRAGTTLFLSNALASLVIANYLGAALRIEFYFKVFPFVTILASRPTFVTVLTWATAVAVFLTCFMVLLGLVRHRKEQKLLDGWASGLVMSGLLILFQYVRHVLDPPAIDGWVLGQSAAGVVAATVIFLGFRPEPEGLASSRRQTPRAVSGQPRRRGAIPNTHTKVKETTS